MHRTSSKLASSASVSLVSRVALVLAMTALGTGCAASGMQEEIAAPRATHLAAVAEAAAVRASMPDPNSDRGVVESAEKAPSLVIVQKSSFANGSDVRPSQGWNARRFLGSRP